jgi:hypothetical protein
MYLFIAKISFELEYRAEFNFTVYLYLLCYESWTRRVLSMEKI